MIVLINYPNCKKIEGQVNIGIAEKDISNRKGTANPRTGDGPIINLNGLSALTSIGSDLLIFANIDLKSLTGLNNLISIGVLFSFLPTLT